MKLIRIYQDMNISKENNLIEKLLCKSRWIYDDYVGIAHAL